MKTTALLLIPVATLSLLLVPARANEAIPATPPPEMQALLAELLKAVAAAQAGAAAAAADEPAPAPAVVEAKAETKTDGKARPPLGSGSSLRTSGLQAGSLTGGRLGPSSSLAGTGAERLSASAWRMLFPAR